VRRWHKNRGRWGRGGTTDGSRPYHWKEKRSLDVKAANDAAAVGKSHPLREDTGPHPGVALREFITQPGLHAKHYGILGYGDRAGG